MARKRQQQSLLQGSCFSPEDCASVFLFFLILTVFQLKKQANCSIIKMEGIKGKEILEI